MCEQLDEPRVYENARADSVEDARDGRRVGRVRIVCRAHPKAHADAQWGRNAVEERGEHWRGAILRGEVQIRESRANAEAFERFCDEGASDPDPTWRKHFFLRTMKDNDDEEHFETLVHGQRETDQDAAT